MIGRDRLLSTDRDFVDPWALNNGISRNGNHANRLTRWFKTLYKHRKIPRPPIFAHISSISLIFRNRTIILRDTVGWAPDNWRSPITTTTTTTTTTPHAPKKFVANARQGKMQKVGAKGTLLTQFLARPFQISSPNKGETEAEGGEGKWYEVCVRLRRAERARALVRQQSTTRSTESCNH